MIHTATIALPPAEVLARAKTFFADRVPHMSAFVEQEAPHYVALRGQGGEEVVIHAVPTQGGSRVRAGTLLFDQVVGRFLSTLPLASAVEVA